MKKKMGKNFKDHMEYMNLQKRKPIMAQQIIDKVFAEDLDTELREQEILEEVRGKMI